MVIFEMLYEFLWMIIDFHAIFSRRIFENLIESGVAEEEWQKFTCY